MTTWTSKGPFAGLALLALTACEEGQGTNAAGAPLTAARMMNGAVTLVAPPGFCIDRSSLRASFALMARCDTLGAPQAAGDAPLGILTASFVAASPQSPLPTQGDLLATPSVTRVLEARSSDDQLVIHATVPAPSDSLSQIHWRGAARIDGHVAAVALYGPDKGRAVGQEGRAIVTRLIDGTRAQTENATAPAKATVAKKTAG